MIAKKFKIEKWDFFIFMLFFSLFIFIISYFIRMNNNYYLRIEKLVEMKLSGRIVKMEDTKRDTYHLKIKTKDSTYNISGIPFNWYQKEYNIEVGDSISKVADSKIITFYKFINGKYIAVLNYELYTRN